MFRILVVEDDRELNRSVCAFLEQRGYKALGCLGAGLMAFCGGTLRSGIDIIFERLGLEQQVAWANLILTGEGRVDATSAKGKLLSGIGRCARRDGKPVVALAGSIGPGSEQLLELGIQAVVPIADGPITLEESLNRAPELIEAAATRAARLMSIGLAMEKPSASD